MSSAEAEGLPVVNEPSIPCRHLRTNRTYIQTDGIGNESADEYDTSVYWCVTTMKNFGPDDEFVCKRDCRSPERTCYEPL